MCVQHEKGPKKTEVNLPFIHKYPCRHEGWTDVPQMCLWTQSGRNNTPRTLDCAASVCVCVSAGDNGEFSDRPSTCIEDSSKSTRSPPKPLSAPENTFFSHFSFILKNNTSTRNPSVSKIHFNLAEICFHNIVYNINLSSFSPSSLGSSP